MNTASPEVTVIFAGALIITASLLFSLSKKEKSESLRLILFLGITAPAIFITLFLAISTIVANSKSATHGPVHWHADMLIYDCGKEVTLRDPSGLSNRLGTTLLHSHGDKRIHVEGTIKSLSDISLTNFFETVGGAMTHNTLTLPINSGLLTLQTGMKCEGQNRQAKLQVFLYKTLENNIIKQIKLDDFPNYVMSAFSTIPPGDCLVIEFDQNKNQTDHICNFYQIAIQKGEYRLQ